MGARFGGVGVGVLLEPCDSSDDDEEGESFAAQPLSWLSPMIKILFLCGLEMHLFLIFTVAVF